MNLDDVLAISSLFVDFDHFGFPFDVLLLVFKDLILLIEGIHFISIFFSWHLKRASRSSRRHVLTLRTQLIFVQQSLIYQLIPDLTSEAQRIDVFIEVKESSNSQFAITKCARLQGVWKIPIVLVHERVIANFVFRRCRRRVRHKTVLFL